jgi:peptidyl-tRNA hydrolase
MALHGAQLILLTSSSLTAGECEGRIQICCQALAYISQPKIAVRCQSTDELEVLAAQARSLNLCARTIQDAGRTQVAAGSKTVLGIGP